MSVQYNTAEYHELNAKTHQLMEMMKNRECYYAPHVHYFLQKEYMDVMGEYNRDVLLPMPKEKWHPKSKSTKWLEYYSAVGMKWPEHSQYAYSMDVFQATAPGVLHFGYGIYANEIVPCAFMVNILFTLKVESDPDRFAPEEYVMDPLALYAGKNPDGYIGVAVPKQFVEEWLLSRNREAAKHPLECYVEERNK